MNDISEKEMGLIIGLVIGTLFLALLAVLIYIIYEKLKEKRNIPIMAPPSQPRTGPPGGGQNWTTINNSMVGLEIEDHHLHDGLEGMEPHGPGGTGNGNGGSAYSDQRKSCLTVLFDWDAKQPLPEPFNNFTNSLWEQAPGEWEPELPSAAGPVPRNAPPPQPRPQPQPQPGRGDSPARSGRSAGGPRGGAVAALAPATSATHGKVQDDVASPLRTSRNQADGALPTSIGAVSSPGTGGSASSLLAARDGSRRLPDGKRSEKPGCCGFADGRGRVSLKPRADIKCFVRLNPLAEGAEGAKPAVQRAMAAAAAASATPVAVLPAGVVA